MTTHEEASIPEVESPVEDACKAELETKKGECCSCAHDSVTKPEATPEEEKSDEVEDLPEELNTTGDDNTEFEQPAPTKPAVINKYEADSTDADVPEEAADDDE